MTYESFPNDEHNNRVVTLNEHEQIVAGLGGLSGLLFWNGAAPLLADSTGLQVKIPANVWASIRGTRFNNTSTTAVPIGANNSGKTRVDLVVLRLRRQETSLGAGNQYTVVPFVIAGTPGDNPVAPAPVRNTTTGSGFWDVPLGEVTVGPGATSIGPAQLKQRGYWITGSGYTGRNDWGEPPVEPGVIFHANDSGVTYIGTAAGSWEVLHEDTGPVSLAVATGFTVERNVLRRRNGLVTAQLSFRPKARMNADQEYTVATIPDGFQPYTDIDGLGNVLHLTLAAQVTATSTGLLRVRMAAALDVGQVTLHPMTWPVA